ncbi:hypothetical protein AB6N16_14050 [Pseudomonas marginalis]
MEGSKAVKQPWRLPNFAEAFNGHWPLKDDGLLPKFAQVMTHINPSGNNR